MPYADKEKQREAQRKWAAKKLVSRPARQSKRGVVSLDEVRAMLKSNKKVGTLTWEQLVGSAFVRPQATYRGYVEAAKKLVQAPNYLNRLAVAAIALEASVIRHGGKVKAGEIRPDSLRQFAKDIGIHHRTLENWCQIKRYIIDRLPSDRQEISWPAARLAHRMLGSKTSVSEVVETYDRLTEKNGAYRKFQDAAKHVKYLKFLLATHGTKILLKKDRAMILSTMEDIKKLLTRT